MRRFVHRAIGIGVPGFGGLVMGVATLGGDEVRTSIWSAIIAVWHDPIALLLCVAGSLALLVIWIWAGHGKDGQDEQSLRQTTHGPHSPAFAARDNATIVIHPPPAAIQLPKSPYGSGRPPNHFNQGQGRVVQDPWWQGRVVFTLQEAGCLVAAVAPAQFLNSERAQSVANEILLLAKATTIPLAAYDKHPHIESYPKGKGAPLITERFALPGQDVIYDNGDCDLNSTITKRQIDRLAKISGWNLPW